MTEPATTDLHWAATHMFRPKRPTRVRRHRLRICRAGVSIDLFAPREERCQRNDGQRARGGT
jgi:hypothetical protein